MKSALLICVCILIQLGVESGYGQESRFISLFGPRVGLTYVVASREDFDEKVQEMFPNSDRTYSPFMTQFGVNMEQRLQLGSTTSHFAFQEVLVVTGIDQGVFLPSGSLLIGFRSHTGLEFGLGPNVVGTYDKDSAEIELAVSVVYAVGWTISVYDVFIPINLAVIPTPADGFPRISLVSGFNFKR